VTQIGACLATVIGAVVVWAGLGANSVSSLGRWVEIVVIGVVAGAVWWWALRPRITAAIAIIAQP